MLVYCNGLYLSGLLHSVLRNTVGPKGFGSRTPYWHQNLGFIMSVIDILCIHRWVVKSMDLEPQRENSDCSMVRSVIWVCKQRDNGRSYYHVKGRANRSMAVRRERRKWVWHTVKCVYLSPWNIYLSGTELRKSKRSRVTFPQNSFLGN